MSDYMPSTEGEKKYSVFAGGSEVNDYLLTKKEAEDLADEWKEDGYDDIEIVFSGM